MNKIIIVSGVLIVVLVAGFFSLNKYIYNEKQDSTNTFEPYRATLSGEFVCLPHRDQSGPQTEECMSGIKTKSGEYYAVDFALMSQMQAPLSAGTHFTASGVLTPIERLSSDQWEKYIVSGIFSVTDSVVVMDEDPGPYACTQEAKICPDGSAVGRAGPRCEFAACPSATATSTRVTTYLGGSVTGMNVTVSPQEVVSDSRCPATVTCVWAGTVEVRTVLSTQVSHGEHVLSLGVPKVFGVYTVTLVGVAPMKTEAAIIGSSYRFTFEIKK